MSANSLKQAVISATSSVITLGSAVSGFNAFTAAADDGIEQTYWVFEGDDFQICTGVYTHSGATLAITHILQKSVSGAVSDLPATGLTLTAAAIVIIGGHGFTQALQYQEGAFSTNYFRPHNQQMTAVAGQVGGEFSASAGAITASTCRFFHPVKITAIGSWVNTASAGGLFSVGLYRVNADGTIGDKVYTTGSLSTTATGLVMETLGSPIIVPAGVYYAVATCDNTTARFAGVEANNCYGSVIGQENWINNGNHESFLRLLTSYAILPTTFIPTSFVTGRIIGVLFQ